MGRQRITMAFVAAISLLTGAGLLLLFQHIAGASSLPLYVRSWGNSPTVTLSLRAAMNQDPDMLVPGGSERLVRRNEMEQGAGVSDNLTQQASQQEEVVRVSRPGKPLVQKKQTEQQPRFDESTTGRRRGGPIRGCKQFRSTNFRWPENLTTIAVVGNGPLTNESRDEINAMDFVIRFNKLQSYRCGEKIDVWASRHGDAVATRYWGIGQKLNITGCPLNKLLELSRYVWLLNGGDGPFNHFMRSFPQIQKRANYLWLDCRRWVVQYMRKYDPRVKQGLPPSSQDQVSPSSGWLILAMVRECAPKGVKIHVYGFNWPKGQWPAHKVPEEEAEVRDLAAKGKIFLHETECKHKYSCSPPASHKATSATLVAR